MMIGLVFLLAVAAVTASPVPNAHAQAHDEQWKAITDGCGQTHACFLEPKGCYDTKDCTLGVSVKVVGTTYTFEMQSVGGVYVALGLSADQAMGDDSVVECVNDNASGADKVSLYASFNKGHSNAREPAATGLTLDAAASSYDADTKTARCTFTRDEITTFQDVEFNLDTTQYYLLLAVGDTATDTGIGFHGVAKVASADKRFLADIGFFQNS